MSDKQSAKLPAYVNVGLMLSATVSWLLTCLLLLTDDTASATVALAMTFGLLLFRVLPHLETFEIGILKAKLRERVETADRLIEEMRAMLGPMARLSLDQAFSSGRWGGLRPEDQLGALKEVIAQMKRLDSDPVELRAAILSAQGWITRDMGQLFISVLARAAAPYVDMGYKEQFSLDGTGPEIASLKHSPENFPLVTQRILDRYPFSTADKERLARLRANFVAAFNKLAQDDPGV
ncbi:MAG: hypothetical protein HWE39_23275 [Oceanospirillaceae bacterium]|uniref:hypothetical protein n=1 Tax=Salipiger sp. HF18 TaxID=2721557 RepID=UPI00142E2A25|nr:hypothetical protein [Salipiger sp. HF18]NIY97284.1 hypothetical protein [Salipiger sp. HF18]NVK44174.1 hypothetical protein [Oceanospirillaceae bacterium]